MMLQLNPDRELLDRLKIAELLFFDVYKLEIDQRDFDRLSPFLDRWGASNALHELFFYQINFIDDSNNQTLGNLKRNRTDFEEFSLLWKLFLSSKLKKIKLTFENGQSVEIPKDSIEYYGDILEKSLQHEKSNQIIELEETGEPLEKILSQKSKELKNFEKQLITTKIRIQKTIPDVRAILEAKNPKTEFTNKQIILCTYCLFYQIGHRLKFRRSSDEMKMEEDKFLQRIEEETNPMLETFEVDRIISNIERETDY